MDSFILSLQIWAKKVSANEKRLMGLGLYIWSKTGTNNWEGTITESESVRKAIFGLLNSKFFSRVTVSVEMSRGVVWGNLWSQDCNISTKWRKTVFHLIPTELLNNRRP